MERKKSEVRFFQEHVCVCNVGPLKDEAAFEGRLLIIEEFHGCVIEWQPFKMEDDNPRGSPEIESLEWEDVPSSVGFKARHNNSLDAVEIKTSRTPKPIKFDIADLKSYKKTEYEENSKTVITFLLKDGTNVPALQFDTEHVGIFLSALDNYIRFKRSKKESNLYLVANPEVEALENSFSQLELFSESKPHIIKKIIQNPYYTALGSFSKVTHFLYDFVVPENDNVPDLHTFKKEPNDISLFNVNIDQHKEPGFELITCIELPPRLDIKRSLPMTLEEWVSFVDSEGRVRDVEGIKQKIFRGGLSQGIRSEAWKYLLGYYDFSMTSKEKEATKRQKNEEYYRMKLQWKTFTPDQESRFSALRDRKSLIEKDVSRTDRTHPFFEGENNSNVQTLQDILMTYCMYNFDLGYVQGMSDLLSPILVVTRNEPDAFWCFASWLSTVGVNFELEQQGMKNQLQDLHRILHFVDSQFCNYLEKRESGNLFFAFRWLLILFKRDFKFQEIMRLWEVLWTGLPCKNFHLLLCVAILDAEKTTIMENGYGLNEILKHVNEMAYKINLETTLRTAEAIYYQIKDCNCKPDTVFTTLGIEREIAETEPEPEPKTTPVMSPGAKTPPSNSSKEKEPQNSIATASNTVNIDDYVDLEQHHQLPFNLFT